MSKRKLSDQQLRRIKAGQQELLDAPLIFNELTHRAAVLVANLGQFLEVLTDDGQVYRCLSRQNLGSLVPGDLVMIEFPEGLDANAVIKAIHPRRTELTRPDRYKQQKCVAANIDIMIIVVASEPECVPYFIDKYLVAGELAGFKSVIVLNKLDALSSSRRQELDHKLAIYPTLGVPILPVSAKTSEGLDPLLQAISNAQAIVVGQSGVGKSSLVNALLGQTIAEVGAMSEANQKGRHTTTTAKLYCLPREARLIDSPGIREFGLWHLPPHEILKGFVEFKPYLNCQFRNCTHSDEAGCALLEAVRLGLVSEERWQSYHRMIQSDH